MTRNAAAHLAGWVVVILFLLLLAAAPSAGAEPPTVREGESSNTHYPEDCTPGLRPACGPRVTLSPDAYPDGAGQPSPIVCVEDDVCWDCSTMGNGICGMPDTALPRP